MDSHPQAPAGTPGQDRQRWMRAFALGEESFLEKGLARLAAYPAYSFLRKPEAGMLMLEGKAGNAGQRFNLGEMLVTRCAVRMASADGVVSGHAYVAGNRPRHAEMAAVLDALMQQPAYAERLEAELVAPLAAAREQARRKTAAETAKTRVDFFTMVRGEDA
ncbi:PhnG protein [uncultured delta proteobacterium]|uniref:PhnG protein n=1 Tax=uncultured delta proteobacterium TaxID=34034 RepID=A0A212K6S3_9DELT|nr:PhnG protein [uncultured delta proteobacterium]